MIPTKRTHGNFVWFNVISYTFTLGKLDNKHGGIRKDKLINEDPQLTDM